MLMKTIEFGKESALWSTKYEYNIAFLKSMEDHINDLIQYRGYIYLNQIYEMLGVRWDPKNENPCIENHSCGRKIFVYFEVYCKQNGTILITIIEVEKGES